METIVITKIVHILLVCTDASLAISLTPLKVEQVTDHSVLSPFHMLGIHDDSA